MDLALMAYLAHNWLQMTNDLTETESSIDNLGTVERSYRAAEAWNPEFVQNLSPLELHNLIQEGTVA